MGAILAVLIITVVLLDFFIYVDRKRWGWMKSWTKYQKGLFFSSFIVVTILFYITI
ncbi:hypothetical protein [Halobacillus sp. Marseille-P3879]|uniref:hypothetical protein n=1 Tax=Halobacillus sp. Marseille-P3879 TaxID=2045014 RepID=UPI00190E8CC7|nr:hypothetical protein [Halobacillus sp. Marseille-P3879]